jgi:hypothetical protein
MTNDTTANGPSTSPDRDDSNVPNLAGLTDQIREFIPENTPGPRGDAAAFTDAQLAEKVAQDVFSGRFCYTPSLSWMRWTGKRWESSTEDAPTEAVRMYFLNWFYREVLAGCGPERQSALNRLLSRGKITAVTSLARGLVALKATDFDSHPDLLNTPNGVVYLRTKQLTPHDPKLLMTKMTAVDYVPGAVS